MGLMRFWGVNRLNRFTFYGVITIFALRNTIYVKYYHYWWYSFMHSLCKLTLHLSHLYTVLLPKCLHLQHFKVPFVRRWLGVSARMPLPAIPDTRRVWACWFLSYISKLSKTISQYKGIFFFHVNSDTASTRLPLPHWQTMQKVPQTILSSHSHSIIFNELVKKINSTHNFVVNFEGFWHSDINVLSF